MEKATARGSQEERKSPQNSENFKSDELYSGMDESFDVDEDDDNDKIVFDNIDDDELVQEAIERQKKERNRDNFMKEFENRFM